MEELSERAQLYGKISQGIASYEEFIRFVNLTVNYIYNDPQKLYYTAINEWNMYKEKESK